MEAHQPPSYYSPDAFCCSAAKLDGFVQPAHRLKLGSLLYFGDAFFIQVEDALLARDQARALEIQSRRELARVLEARKV